MSRLVRATELTGLPVVTLTGDDVAEVRDVVYEPSRGGLVGFTLNKRGFFSGRMKDVLAIADVASIGKDAVMVADTDALTEKANAPASIREAGSDRDVIGISVMTDEGTELGRVSDVVIQLGRKSEAVGYQLDHASDRDRHLFIPLPEQISISGDALMVPHTLDRFIRDDLTGFGGAIDEFRADHGTTSRASAGNGAATLDQDRSDT